MVKISRKFVDKSPSLCHIVHHYVVLLSVWDFVQYYQEYKHWHNSITHTTVISAFIVVWGLFWHQRYMKVKVKGGVTVCLTHKTRKRVQVYMNEWKNDLVTANWVQACIRLEVGYWHCYRKRGDGWDSKYNSKRDNQDSNPKRHQYPLCIVHISVAIFPFRERGYYVGQGKTKRKRGREILWI